MKSFIRSVSLIIAAVLMLTFVLTGCASTGTSTDGTASSGGSGYTTIIMLVLLVVIFYFFLIRPESKKKKKAEEMRSNLSIGDTITTIGGMIGKIVYISDDFLVFESGDDRVRIKVAKWAVSTVGKATEEPK